MCCACIDCDCNRVFLTWDAPVTTIVLPDSSLDAAMDATKRDLQRLPIGAVRRGVAIGAARMPRICCLPKVSGASPSKLVH